MIIKCPVCGGLQVGRVGSDQYYCWNCFLNLISAKVCSTFMKWLKMGPW